MNAVETLVRLRKRGLVQMGLTGQWELSRRGEELLDELQLLGEIAAARDEQDAGGMSQRTRAGRRPEQRNGGSR